MTELERKVLAILAAEDAPRSVPVLQFRHRELKAYKPRQLFHAMTELHALGLITRAETRPEREMRYRITSDGHQRLILS